MMRHDDDRLHVGQEALYRFAFSGLVLVDRGEADSTAGR
jgi:hypothetical protein